MQSQADASNNDNSCRQRPKRAKITQSDDEEEISLQEGLADHSVEISSVAAATPRRPSVVPPSSHQIPTVAPSPMTCPNEIQTLLHTHAAGYDVSSPSKTSKRADYLSWDTYFMATAILAGHRSKDPLHPTGACLVDTRNRILGTGYNGLSRGWNDDDVPWQTEAKMTTTDDDDAAATTTPWLHTSTPYVVGAALNAVLNRSQLDCTGARLYTPVLPGPEAAQVLVQARISEVVVLEEAEDPNATSDPDDSVSASRVLFALAGVKIRSYSPEISSVTLDFQKALHPSEVEAAAQDKEAEQESAIGPESPDFDLDQRQAQHEILDRELGYTPPAKSTKRKDYLAWTDYFLSMALLTAQRSKDPNTQVGACLVDSHNRIVGLGYNGFPSGCSDDILPWSRQASHPLHTKYMYVCHAEVNAIMNSNHLLYHSQLPHVGASTPSAPSCTLYVALFPCHNCAKLIVQCQTIQTVVYLSDRYHETDSCRASRAILALAGITTRRHVPDRQSFRIDLIQGTSGNMTSEESKADSARSHRAEE